ncbi:hypothetical protein [Candidatus Methylobacter oryzae]|uniref:WYL domain-containing protein n=1 Tax=Candidatus Methylobacter oryzae TaxID=2497749 RepID=A0ABY3C4H0_9GAMM|nr:hypothetical protein [Candidatus Methylobacter oryzae]TRW89558.1 hypothetical protein EKO24_021080 [Candidatus Methylobacter oryzae]
MELSEHIALNRPLAESICQRLVEEIHELGFTNADIQRYPSYDDADFVLVKDPYAGTDHLTCYWYDGAKRQRIGRLQFNSDGTFYAEYDVVRPHPTKTRRFVEGVTAWGKAEQIKSEAKLLEMPA